MTFDQHTVVTPAKPTPSDKLRPFGRIVSHAEAPLTGERMNMVLWDGAAKPLAYYDDELAIAD
ncbi:hypothetical protein AB0B50_04225 [Streptomyces sp. NPDC041068]|uniref:hypothetical protein n=1 Tax=Streptomyces sp. NPDC041068 TaxID=3155130 RepID=UPI0033EBE150